MIKKILKLSLLIFISLTSDLLALDDSENTSLHSKIAKVADRLHENWFKATPKTPPEYIQEEHKRSLPLEKFRQSFTESGLSELFGI